MRVRYHRQARAELRGAVHLCEDERPGRGFALEAADLLVVPVYGTTANLRSRHYDGEGLDPASEVLLASDVVLRRRVSSRTLLPDLDPRQARRR